MAGKWIEMLKEIAPPVARVALLFNPATAPYAENWLNPFKVAAASFGIQGTAALVHDTSELESVLAAQAREPNGGLIVMPDTFTTARRAEITALAARHRLPTVYPFRYFAQSGGPPSYGLIWSMISGARRPMPIASLRARNRASFPSRAQSSSSW